MATMSSSSSWNPLPLRKENSIEVIPGSSPASSELTYALIKERSRSSRLTSEAYLSSLAKMNRDRPPTPFAASSSTRDSSILTDSQLIATNTPSKTNELSSLHPSASTPPQKQEPAQDRIDKEDTSSTTSSEKENSIIKLKDRKSKRKGLGGVMRLLRTKPIQSKSRKAIATKEPVEKSPPKVETNAEAKAQLEKSRRQTAKEKNFNQKTGGLEDFMIPPDSEEDALEKAKAYTMKSLSLLDSLKSDSGGDDVHDSIRQAKLAYEYAMRARQLYNTVGSRRLSKKGTAKPPSDESVYNTSVDSSHITEKAGNVTRKDFHAETPAFSLLLDSAGNEAHKMRHVSSNQTSIEIEHDGMILFEAPATTSSPTMEGNIAYNELDAILKDTDPLPRATADSNVVRALSPHPNFLGQQTAAQSDSRERTYPKDQVTPKILPTQVEETISTVSSDNDSLAEEIHSDSQPHLGRTDKVKRSRSNIIYPPALHLSRSSVSETALVDDDDTQGVLPPSEEAFLSLSKHDDTESIVSSTTTASQRLLIEHRENRLKERMKEMQLCVSPEDLVKCGSGPSAVENDEIMMKHFAFEADIDSDIDVEGEEFSALQQEHRRRMEELGLFNEKDFAKCSNGLKCGGTNTDAVSKEPKTKYATRVVVYRNAVGLRPDVAAFNDHAPTGFVADRNRPSLWQKVRNSSEAAVQSGMVRVRSTSQAAKDQLQEVSALADEIMKGEVDVLDEVNPFTCSRSSKGHLYYDDATYDTYSDGSDSLTEGRMLYTDNDTFEDTLGTASTRSDSGQKVKSGESAHMWVATWESDENESGSGPSDPLPHEMTVLSSESKLSDVSSESDSSSSCGSQSEDSDAGLDRKRFY